MEIQTQDVVEKCHQVTIIMKKHMHILDSCQSDPDDEKEKYAYNNRIVLSDCLPFLEAVRSEIGGEIIEDSVIGPFLYYEEEKPSGSIE